jgi:hypothetical protein
MRSLPGGLRA